MKKLNFVYIGSLRNAAADNAGQYIEYKSEKRYMRSVLEYLADMFATSDLNDQYNFRGIIFDDDEHLPTDQEKLSQYGFSYTQGNPWFYPSDLEIQGQCLVNMSQCIPSSYRKHPLNSQERIDGKIDFENRLKQALDELEADVVLLDGLLIILDKLIQSDSPYYRKIVNIHPGITADNSPYQRRGAYATLDALYGAKGQKVIDWKTMQTQPVEPVMMTGASFHYVDAGIDSGEVITDVLNTPIDPEDTILEMRWNNFEQSLFPATYNGLKAMAKTLS